MGCHDEQEYAERKTHLLGTMNLASIADLVRYAIAHKLLESPDIPKQAARRPAHQRASEFS